MINLTLYRGKRVSASIQIFRRNMPNLLYVLVLHEEYGKNGVEFEGKKETTPALGKIHRDQPAGHVTSLLSIAYRVKSALPFSLIFMRMRARYVLTVFTLKDSSSPISLTVLPEAIMHMT